MSAEYEVELESWLSASFNAVHGLLGRSLALVRVFRTSSARADVFIANLETGLTSADDSEPSVRLAREVGGLIVQQSVEGEAERLKRDVFTLRMWHLEGGSGRAVVGYLVVFEGVLFVYLLASAAKQNLSAQHVEDNANAACETLRKITRTLTGLAWRSDPSYRLRTMFTDETRPARSEDAGNALIRTWTANRAWVEINGVSYDTTDPDDVKALRRLITFASDERDSNTRRMAKGKAALLVSHSLPDTAYWTVPFT